MNRKKLTTILATIAIIVTLSVSLFYPFGSATASTYNADNMTVTGVLASDSYVLYPHEKENLIFGFSKYGELINGVAKQGLEYDGLDVFANPNVLEKDWSQGWFIDIHYADLENNFKRAWAFALYSDLSGSTGIGGPWREGCTHGPLGIQYGGRKTNVWATTDPIKVLYDGPRRFVAVTNTTIYDNSDKTTDDALVSITITIVFNKVKKNVILFKDIKRLDKGKFGRTFQVEFSNRGEWDIGVSSAPPSYAHFYDNLTTVYDHHYHEFYDSTNDITGFDVCQMIDEDGDYVGWAAFWPQLFGKLVDGTSHITRSTILTSLCTVTKNYTWASLDPDNHHINFTDLGWPSADPHPIGLGAVDDEPMVYKNSFLLTGGGVDYSWDGSDDTLTFAIEPEGTDYITVVYKHEVNGGVDDMVDHVGVGNEPDTPYVIGEWVFNLENADHKRQYRAVTMYGLTERHDGDDDDASAEIWSGTANVIDSEVQYYLDETFNPYDLYSAVHKNTRRHVWIDDVEDLRSVQLPEKPFRLANWDEYCTFSERVLLDGVLLEPLRADRTTYDYSVTVDGYGYGTIHFPAPGVTGHLKILYSTDAVNHEIGYVSSSIELDRFNVSSSNRTDWGISLTPSWDTPLGTTYGFGADIDFTVHLIENATDWADSWHWDWGWNETDFKVFRNETYVSDIDTMMGPINATIDVRGDSPVARIENFTVSNVYKDVTADADETVHVYNLNWGLSFDISLSCNSNGSGYWFNFTWTTNVDYEWYESIGGSYEWMVVGKDAATIDSIGAAYMTQAFDSKKQIHVTMTGLDINDTANGPYAPFVMAGATTGTKADYRDSLGRPHLRDDWCTRHPVSSSNMLFSGGPIVNLGTEYFNEFTNAFWARTEYVVNDTGHAYKILALSCWDRNSYGDGYAVISVYKDINGTIGFLIWGTNGQDTYYATKWFWDVGIEYLQTENRGVTDIILKITYPPADPIHPIVTVSEERLGTISEKTQHDCPG